MSARSWLRGKTIIDGKPIGCHTIRCSEDGCTNVHELLDQRESQLPAEIIEKKLGRLGWFVGSNTNRDICPDCQAKKMIHRRKHRNGNRSPSIVPQEIPPMAQVEAPTPMTREDRRIIFSKITEVYLDETRGYETPWSDKKVADALNCPLAWVATVREEMFGPAHDNAEVRAIISEIHAKLTEANKVLADAKRLREDAINLMTRSNTINATITKFEGSLDVLLRTAERIQKAVA